MMVKSLREAVYWTDPETGEVILPGEYKELPEEQKRKLTMHIKGCNEIAAFAYCPACNKWHDIYYTDSIDLFAKDCKEREALRTLSFYDFDLVSAYIYSKPQMRKNIVLSRLNKHVEKTLRRYKKTKNEHHLKNLEAMIDIAASVMPYEEIKQMKEKLKKKLITYYLKK